MLRKLLLAAMVAVAAPQLACAADDPKVITWDDLVPKMEAIDNPFDKIDPEVLEQVGYVLRAREDLKLGFLKEDSAEWKNALSVERDLLKDGIDVKGLITAGEKMMAEVERRNGLTNSNLDGEVVRMPGYALPLEQSAEGVTEFLLVPYVGACITSRHRPPIRSSM